MERMTIDMMIVDVEPDANGDLQITSVETSPLYRPDVEDKPVLPCLCVPLLIAALISGVLGFGVLTATAAWVAKVFFVVFLVLFLVSLFNGDTAPKGEDHGW